VYKLIPLSYEFVCDAHFDDVVHVIIKEIEKSVEDFEYIYVRIFPAVVVEQDFKGTYHVGAKWRFALKMKDNAVSETNEQVDAGWEYKKLLQKSMDEEHEMTEKEKLKEAQDKLITLIMETQEKVLKTAEEKTKDGVLNTKQASKLLKNDLALQELYAQLDKVKAQLKPKIPLMPKVPDLTVSFDMSGPNVNLGTTKPMFKVEAFTGGMQVHDDNTGANKAYGISDIHVDSKMLFPDFVGKAQATGTKDAPYKPGQAQSTEIKELLTKIKDLEWKVETLENLLAWYRGGSRGDSPVTDEQKTEIFKQNQ
jgi:hypothetical protein